MDFPHPGMKVYIESDGQLLEYLDTNGNIQTVQNIVTSISNYEYELKENENKRTILILRPEYVGAFVSDMRDMMRYKKSSQYVDSSTKRAFNPRNNRT